MKKIVVLILIALGYADLCRAENMVALTSGNRLLFFDSATPGTITKSFTITTASNEALVEVFQLP